MKNKKWLFVAVFGVAGMVIITNSSPSIGVGVFCVWLSLAIMFADNE